MIESIFYSSVTDEIYFRCSEVDALAGAGMKTVPMIEAS